MFESTIFDILGRMQAVQEPAVEPSAKEAFTPSPAMEQSVLSGGGQGMPPGGMDPAAMAAMQGGGGMPGGAPGGPPPGAEGGGGPMPTPGDPASAGGAPPGAPSDAPPDPIGAKLDTLIQLIQQGQQGGGAAGQSGKPNTASIKFEPAHFQQMSHKISVMESVLRRISEAMGIEVPAAELFNVAAPGQSLPGAQGQPGQPGQPAQPGGDPTQAGGAPPAPSPIAQQLPTMPPVAGKAAADTAYQDAQRLGQMLKAGRAVPAAESNRPSRGAALAAVAAMFDRKTAGAGK